MAVHVHDRVTIALDLHHVVVVQVYHFLGVVDDGGYVTGQEKVIVVSDAENQGASSAGTDHCVGVVTADDGKTEGPLDEGQRLQNSFFQVSVIISGN